MTFLYSIWEKLGAPQEPDPISPRTLQTSAEDWGHRADAGEQSWTEMGS